MTPSPVQITALLFLPDFPGWLAPLHFNPGMHPQLAGTHLTMLLLALSFWAYDKRESALLSPNPLCEYVSSTQSTACVLLQ